MVGWDGGGEEVIVLGIGVGKAMSWCRYTLVGTQNVEDSEGTVGER